MTRYTSPATLAPRGGHQILTLIARGEAVLGATAITATLGEINSGRGDLNGGALVLRTGAAHG